jgi:hypothetical protein
MGGNSRGRDRLRGSLPKTVGGLCFHEVCGGLRVSYRWIKNLAKSSLIWLGTYALGPQPDKAGSVGILGV